MAMINCPECEQPVSDQAEKCVHCGYDLKGNFREEEKHICIECGNELKEGEAFCPKCGCPVSGRTEPVHEMPESEYEAPKKKKTGSIIAAVVAIIVVVVIGFFIYSGNQQEKYGDAIYEASLIIQETGEVEKDMNLVMSVWLNAIYEEHDENTDKYTCPDGVFVSDFNEALENLYSDEEFKNRINTVMENQVKIRGLKAKMKNPPKGFETGNEYMLDTMNAYIEYTNILLNPSGTYDSVSEDINEKANTLVDAYMNVVGELQAEYGLPEDVELDNPEEETE